MHTDTDKARNENPLPGLVVVHGEDGSPRWRPTTLGRREPSGHVLTCVGPWNPGVHRDGDLTVVDGRVWELTVNRRSSTPHLRAQDGSRDIAERAMSTPWLMLPGTRLAPRHATWLAWAPQRADENPAKDIPGPALSTGGRVRWTMTEAPYRLAASWAVDAFDGHAGHAGQDGQAASSVLLRLHPEAVLEHVLLAFHAAIAVDGGPTPHGERTLSTLSMLALAAPRDRSGRADGAPTLPPPAPLVAAAFAGVTQDRSDGAGGRHTKLSENGEVGEVGEPVLVGDECRRARAGLLAAGLLPTWRGSVHELAATCLALVSP